MLNTTAPVTRDSTYEPHLTACIPLAITEAPAPKSITLYKIPAAAFELQPHKLCPQPSDPSQLSLPKADLTISAA